MHDPAHARLISRSNTSSCTNAGSLPMICLTCDACRCVDHLSARTDPCTSFARRNRRTTVICSRGARLPISMLMVHAAFLLARARNWVVVKGYYSVQQVVCYLWVLRRRIDDSSVVVSGPARLGQDTEGHVVNEVLRQLLRTEIELVERHDHVRTKINRLRQAIVSDSINDCVAVLLRADSVRKVIRRAQITVVLNQILIVDLASIDPFDERTDSPGAIFC